MKTVRTRYRSCPCGEWRRSTLPAHRRGCPNCRSGKTGRGSCLVCGRERVPIQRHHVALERHSPLTVPLCLNCHATITAQQQRYWPDNLTSASYLTLGWAALLMMALPFGRDAVIRAEAGDALKDFHHV